MWACCWLLFSFIFSSSPPSRGPAQLFIMSVQHACTHFSWWFLLPLPTYNIVARFAIQTNERSRVFHTKKIETFYSSMIRHECKSFCATHTQIYSQCNRNNARKKKTDNIPGKKQTKMQQKKYTTVTFVERVVKIQRNETRMQSINVGRTLPLSLSWVEN